MTPRAPRPIPVRRLWQAIGAVALVAVAFAQSGSLTSPDTKLDLLINPLGFLSRSLSAWDPQAAFGQVQNQAYGYLWPMGPFFVGGDLLGLPPWIVQRLWWSLLLVVAYAGMLTLLALWRIGTPTTRVVAAMAFALSPRVLSVMGTISAEAWPLAVLPWILIPLVRGARDGDPRRWALWSALAVACVGAVNAVATLAVLVPAVVFLLTRERSRRRRSLMLWWSAGTVLACLWWVIPLLVQSRVAPPFLSAIESAQVTTAPASMLNALRGTAQWLAYVGGGSGPVWEAGGWLAVTPWGIIGTAAVAALGIGGLAGHLGGERRFLALTALIGLLAIGVGYAGAVGSPLSGVMQQLLDGPLAPLRNVHKADPLIRLPLAVGLCSALAALPKVLQPVARRLLEVPNAAREIRYSRVLATVLVVPVLVLAVLPALQGRLAAPGSFLGVPGEWTEVADELTTTSGTTLLVPASNFGDYTWGRPLDEPMQSLARSPWAVRNAIPLGAPGATRLLDGVQEVLARGASDAHLADALAAAGVSQLVLRNSLDPFTTIPSAAAARATLVSSPDIKRVAGFGFGGSTSAGTPGLASGVEPLMALEVFTVDAPVTDAVVVSNPVVASGGPEALAGALAGVPTLLNTDAGDAPVDVVTDTYRLRSQNFGAERGRDLTTTLWEGVDATRGRPAADISPWPGAVARSELAAPPSATASSSASDPFGIGFRGLGVSAQAAADGDPATAWVSEPGDADPWWQRTFPSQPISRVVLDVVTDPVLATVSSVVVEAGGRVVEAPVGTEGRVEVNLGGVVSDHVRVDLRTSTTEPVSLVDVVIDGVPPEIPTVTVPGEAPAARLVSAPAGRGDCLRTRSTLVTCARGSAIPGEEDAGWRRSVTLTTPARLTGATVALRPGSAAGALLDRSHGLEVAGSSTWVSDPLARPGAALDGDFSTAWLPRHDDSSPTLTITYPTPVTVNGLVVVATVPEGELTQATVSAGGASRTVDLTARRVPLFAPITGRVVTVRFEVVRDAPFALDPVRINQVTLLGAPAPRTDAVVTVQCGAGPVVKINGDTVPLSVTAPAAALLSGSAVPASPCSDVEVQGRTTVTAASTPQWRVNSIDLGTLPTPTMESVTTTRLGDESAEWVVPAGTSQRVLATTWGFNRGWVASLGGVPLEPVRVDGWRQGWRLPATSADGVVAATFAPGRWHRAGLIGGGVTLLVLLALALMKPRSTGWPQSAPRQHSRWPGVGFAFASPVLIGGVAGLAAVGVVAGVTRFGTRVRMAGVVGAVALLVAGGVSAVTRGGTWGAGVWSGVAQFCALLSVASVAVLSAGMRPRSTQQGQLNDAPTDLSHEVRDHDSTHGEKE